MVSRECNDLFIDLFPYPFSTTYANHRNKRQKTEFGFLISSVTCGWRCPSLSLPLFPQLLLDHHYVHYILILVPWQARKGGGKTESLVDPTWWQQNFRNILVVEKIRSRGHLLGFTTMSEGLELWPQSTISFCRIHYFQLHWSTHKMSRWKFE